MALWNPRINIIGPKPGYSPHIGSLVSMLTRMRWVTVGSLNGLTLADLDREPSQNSNTIGALLLHLAATETCYQMNTFNGVLWGKWSDEAKQKWNPALDLGEEARRVIKGHELGFYLDTLQEIRDRSLTEFCKRDDHWLMAIDESWPWGPTNNYCKWFHVCEHESHHGGQIATILHRQRR